MAGDVLKENPSRFDFSDDTGNVWPDRFDIDFSDLVSTAGVGLRLDLPGFPIRIDRAWPIERDDRFTSEDAWSIWIGYDF